MKKTRKTPYFIVGALLLCGTFSAQTIISSTVGTTSGYSGDGGQASLAKLTGPTSMVYDPAGNMYIADAGNNCIRKVNASGIITTIAGTGTAGFGGDGGPATAAQFDAPVSLALDAVGNLYVADRNNNRIRKINNVGTISTYAGNGNAFFNGDGGKADTSTVFWPSGICFDNSGNLLIADYGHYRLRSVNAAGTMTTVAGIAWGGYSGDGGSAIMAALMYPANVFVDPSSNIYVADFGNSTIRKINSSGIISTFAGIGNSSGYSGDGGAATSAKLIYPYGMAIDGGGNFYFSDLLTHTLRKINPGGIINTESGNGTAGFGGDGGSPALAIMEEPCQIIIPPSGNIYIADSKNNRIRIITQVTGIQQNELDDRIVIYPNPSSGVFMLTVSSEEIKVRVYDLLGNCLWNKDYSNDVSPKIDLSGQPKGVYFMEIMSEGQRAVKKIVVQ